MSCQRDDCVIPISQTTDEPNRSDITHFLERSTNE